MSAMQRNKGRAGEQEVARLIRDHLGLDITRAWQRQAARKSNSDLDGLPGWAVEVKWAKTWRSEWWEQAQDQGIMENATPALVYRLDQKGVGLPPILKWRVIVPLAAICSEDVDPDHTAEITLAAWMQIIRERIDARDTAAELASRAAPPPVPRHSRRLRQVPKTTPNAA